jgi:hypothetical protein
MELSMIAKRIGLATAVVAMTSLSACSMWHSMTDRMSGRSDSGGTTMSSSGTSGTAMPRSGAPMPGASANQPGTMSPGAMAMPGSAMASARGPMGMPPTAMRNFRTYNECRAWFSQQGGGGERVLPQGGEITLADTDPCAGLRGS